MKYNTGSKLMNLPNYIKFGCEIEVQNVDIVKLKKEIEENYPELSGWKITKDGSVMDYGAEIVSPPLSELKNPNVYEDFGKILDLIKSCPHDKKRIPYVNAQCGGHIHLDATMMRKNPEMMESFLRLWAESEELIFKMCNAKNNPIRESAIRNSPVNELIKALSAPVHGIKDSLRKTIRGVTSISNSFFSLNGYARNVSGKLQSVGKNKDLISNVVETSSGNKFKFNRSLKKDLASHYTGINMQHLSADKPIYRKIHGLGKSNNLNTYEFRIHNSSLDLETWKQNIFFDSAISKIAYEMAYEPGKNDSKLSAFFEKDISEEEKVNRFLDLLFENEEDKKIYKDRWESVKDAPVFSKMKKSRMSKTYLKDVAMTTNSMYIANTMGNIFNKVKAIAKDFVKGNEEMDYGGRV